MDFLVIDSMIGIMVENKIWFDTDFGSDVDDALALLFMVRTGRKLGRDRLFGITTSYGPTNERAKSVTTLLRKLGRGNIMVFTGSEQPLSNSERVWFTGKEADGADEDEVESIAALSDDIVDDFSLLVTGPGTNIHDLFRVRSFREHCREVVVMGGSFQSAKNVPEIENNFEGDPKALQLLLMESVPITIIPVDLSLRFPLSEHARSLIAKGVDPVAQLIKRWADNWMEFTRNFPVDSPFRERIYLHDPMAAAYLFLSFIICT